MFDTKIVELARNAPVNLAADADLAGRAVFVQNTGTTNVYFASTTAAPDENSTGHILRPNETLSVEFEAANDFAWFWAKAMSGGRLAVSPGA